MTSSFRLAHSSRFALRLAASCNARCARSTSASQHIHYEHPRLVGFWFVVGGFRHQRESRECSVSRRRESLRRARCSLTVGRSLPRGVTPDRASDTPVARPLPPAWCFRTHHRASSGSAKTVSTAVSVKRLRLCRSEVPSLGRWRNPHACRTAFPRFDRLIVAFRRSRDFAATVRSSS